MDNEIKVAAKTLEKAAEKLVGYLYPRWECVSKADLEQKNPRGKEKLSFNIPGSFLYVAYENEKVLYVGESFVTVRRRFLGNGKGAHNRKGWYARVTHVFYARFDHEELSDPYRKMLEQALAIVLEPEFYGRTE